MKDYSIIKGYIYKITSPNGKIYIGQTTNPEQRKGKYSASWNMYKGVIYHSIRKYGWENHTFEIIEELICGENKCYLNEREIYWIEKYDSFNSGLNLTKGGNGGLGYKHTEETKAKLSEKNYLRSENGYIPWNKGGGVYTDEMRKKMSESQKGKKHTKEQIEKTRKANLGRIVSEETRIKIGKAHKGMKLSDEIKNKIRESRSRILIEVDGVIYKSVSEAASELKVSDSAIYRRIKSDNFPNYKKIIKNEDIKTN